jgi:hypothetical protein
MSRNRIAFEVSDDVPAAGANSNSDSIDLEAVAPGAVGGELDLEMVVPALASLADDKDLDIHFEDSADDTTFADIEGTPTIKLTGASGTGAGAKTVKFRLPPDVKRYIRFNVAKEAAGGDDTGVDVTLYGKF